MRLKWAKEKLSWSMDNWMKIILSDQLRIFIGQVDDIETFVCCSSNKTYKDGCLKKSFLM